MGKPEGDQPNPQEPTVSEPDKLVSTSEAASSARAASEITTVAAMPQPDPVVASAPAAIPQSAPIVATVEPPKLESAIAEPVTPRADEIRPADVRFDETIAPAAPSLLSGWTTSLARTRRLAPLAATIAIAAALGALAGSFATAELGGQAASAPVAQSADARALKEQVARLHADIAALKASIDSSAKAASAQSIKLGDRLDRFEKAQAEPTARLAKLADAVERIERRTPTTVAAAAHDITGSVSALAPAPQLEAPETRPASPPVLEGWRVRSVYNGAALIQARSGGVIEVEPGDNLPGLGRIEAIRRQEGRWVVVTSKGVIHTR